MRSILFVALAIGFLGVSSSAIAQAPDSLSFQGLLTDIMGNPMDSTGVSITFKLYKGSTPIWSETQMVSVDSGVFNVYLGAVTAMDTVAFNQPIDLGIKLDGEASEISPRTPLVAAAYAKALPGLYTFYRVVSTRRSYNVVGGAANNVVGSDVVGATIGGGGGSDSGPVPNSVLAHFATVGGGSSNTASGRYATVSGGNKNSSIASSSTVGGGLSNMAVAGLSTIGGGQGNRTIGLYSTVGGGFENVVNGRRATVPGGSENSATGDYSFAAGFKAKANHDGTFVWNDRSSIDALESTGPNQFLIRAAGGVGMHGPVNIFHTGDGVALLNLSSERSWAFRQLNTGSNTALELASVGGGGNKNFIINTTGFVGIGTTTPAHPLHMASGAHVTAGGTWTSMSSRMSKQDFEPVDPSLVLERVVDLDVMRWRYKAELESVHMGPVAEDFHGAFGLGADDQHIASLDGNGVALAAIQGLYLLVQELQLENERMRDVMEGAGLK